MARHSLILAALINFLPLGLHPCVDWSGDTDEWSARSKASLSSALCPPPPKLYAATVQRVFPDAANDEVAGERPYEMVWAHRHEPAPPTLRFDQLAGWTIETTNGAEATLHVSRAQNVWERPVAKLRYRGDSGSGSKPRIWLKPPQPIVLSAQADSVDAWVYGNRWDWENPPDTPAVRIVLHLRDGEGNTTDVSFDRVRWKEWWLIHRRIPAHLLPSVRLESIEIADGWQKDWREIFLDSIRFYQEELAPLTFGPRPKRNLTLFDGQSSGANTGPGKLAFPIREQTILPMHLSEKFKNEVREADGLFIFTYRGGDSAIQYRFAPETGLSGLSAAIAIKALGSSKMSETFPEVGRLLEGGGVRTTAGATNAALKSTRLNRGTLTAEYSDGTTLHMRLWKKSLVLDVFNRTGQATELSFGRISGVAEARLIRLPYLNYGGGAHPCVLLSRAGSNNVFTSIWLDWYRSNGSEPYAAESVAANSVRINGGVRYLPRTDHQRNPMFERLFITVSPEFEEVLPSIPNPAGLHARSAIDRLWQETWGPDDYEKQIKRSRMLRAYGIEKLIQCNHEIAWRDGGESFTLRTSAAPKKGGDEALNSYVAQQRGLGWFAGLYSNYTDFAPVNEHWTPDAVQRGSDGNWRSAWPRCWALKPLKAVEFDAKLAPQIKRKFNSNSAYTDVHTAVAPWGYNDYDARVPGAGTFTQTFYAYGELLRNDSRVYGGPIFSEGTYQWLYAGLADGNYALAYDGHPLAKEPLLPVFDLYQIHTKECDIGMGWTANFCDAIPEWRRPENIDRAIDRFLLHTMAYGHIGWLVEEEHGITRTCRSYYMLQAVQARYGLQAPSRLAYWNGAEFLNVSSAIAHDLPRSRRQLLIEYPSGLRLWFNDHPTESWRVQISDTRSQVSDLTLPPAGWAVSSADGQLFSFSALRGSNKVDYLRSPSYTYLDGRGHRFSTPEAESNGVLAISPLRKGQLQVIRASGSGAFLMRRPYNMPGQVVSCDAYDAEGKRLRQPTWKNGHNETQMDPVETAIRYVLRFEKKE